MDAAGWGSIVAVVVEVFDYHGDLQEVRITDGERWELDGGVLDVFAGSMRESNRKRIATFADRGWRSVKLDEASE